MSLQRVNALSWRGFAPGMDWLDGGASIKPMIRPTVADDVTVHVANRYFSFGDKDLSFIGGRGKLPRQPISMGCTLIVQFVSRCSLTLICSSLIQRLTLAAACAAAFFMEKFTQLRGDVVLHNLQKDTTTQY